VKHVIDLLFRDEDEIRDVVFNEPEILVPGEMAMFAGLPVIRLSMAMTR